MGVENIERHELKIQSSDGKHILCGAVFVPTAEKKGFFQVVHGMTEHITRYEAFMRDMAEAGYVCFGCDNLGHGGSVSDDSELGYIADENGWKLLVEDVKTVSEAVISRYSENEKEGLPYFLMGHSMGSFIVRLAATEAVKPDALIVMGTGGYNPATGAGLLLARTIGAVKGKHSVSPLLYKLAFGGYNKRFGGGSADDASPWLTTDEEIRKKYYADKYCTFKFTVSAMIDLMTLTRNANSAKWYESIPKELPVLLVSGEEDPVGAYGKGVREVERKLSGKGIDCRCIIYPKARHEILNDFTYAQVKGDILEFCANASEKI